MDTKEAVEIVKAFLEYKGLGIEVGVPEALETLIDFAEQIQEIHQKVMGEKCASDEIHCTCVPVLRQEIKELKLQLSFAEGKKGSKLAFQDSIIEGLKLRIKVLEEAKMREPFDKDKFTDICAALLEKTFPKGECKERGQALVLVGLLAVALQKFGMIGGR